MLPNNSLLQDRYRIAEQIGRGGMGAVYKATDTRLRTIVALKQTLVEGEPLRRAFEREAQLLASLRHPTLPRVSDHFVDQQGQFLVMEYIPGDDLGALLEKRRRPFEVADVLRWADQLLDALDYLHTREPSVIHRDIKPQNMKLTERGEIILLDFGLAKGAAVQTRVTSTGSIFGYTPHYAPLEQIQGTGTDRRSDLYSLAATMYQLLTNQIPVDALTRATAMVNEEPDPLALANEINPEVPPAVAAVLFQAMAQRASQRPPSAAAMRDMLRGAAKGATRPIAAPEIDTVAAAMPPPVLPGAAPTIAGPAPQPAPPTEIQSGPRITQQLAALEIDPPSRNERTTITPMLPPPVLPPSQPAAARPRRGLWLLVIPIALLLGAAGAYASGAFTASPAAATPTQAVAAAATSAPAPTNTPAPTIDILQAAGATQTIIAATQQAFNSLVGQASQQTTTALAAGQQTSAAQTQTAAPSATPAPTATSAPTAAPAAAGPTRTPRPTSTPGARQPTATSAPQASSGSVLSVGSGGELFKGSARKGTIAPEEGQGGSCIQGRVLASDGGTFSSFYVQADNRGKTLPAKHFYDSGNYKICGLGAGEWGVAVYAVNGTPTSGAEQAGHQVRVNLSGQPGEVFFVDFRARAGFAPPTETPEPSAVPPTPTPEPGPYDGQWSGPISGKTVGDTEFHGSFRMEIRGNAIYRISIDGPSCLFETYPNFPSGKPLAGAGFAVSGSPFNPKLGTDASITFSVNGSFSSASKASGTLSASQNGGGCADATWSAAKQ